MIDINRYLQDLISECKAAFAERLVYVGLQGSYLRGEANDDSDIDIMLILDRFSVEDMDTYRSILMKIGHFEKSCGFICGKDDMARWNPLEVCQLRHTTKDLFGSLSDYLPSATRQDEIRYVKLGVGNLYHELCHRYIHSDREKNIRKLRSSGKALFFLIQNLYYLESGVFVPTKDALKKLITEEDREALSLTELSEEYDFDKAFRCVFQWCQNALQRLDRME
ncbi:MAG: nucleotidyltransferase domain-containing protein [Clostridia bacterium]|nr:nucleotidyltransferase domain-containing protein [Clostridia bacterium]